jgi:hypothetical protein
MMVELYYSAEFRIYTALMETMYELHTELKYMMNNLSQNKVSDRIAWCFFQYIVKAVSVTIAGSVHLVEIGNAH